MRFRLTLFVVAVFVFVHARPASAATPVPFTLVDNRMVIQCTIDGKGPFSMIVDTGSPDVTIDSQTATTLALRVRNAGSATGAGNKAVQMGSAQLASLAIGAQSFDRLDVSVLDLSEIRTKLHFSRLDGIVGYSIMKRFAVVVDVDAGTIALEIEPPAPPSPATSTSFTGVIPVVPATIDGVATTVIIDTGDRSSLTLFGPFASAHRFYGRYPSQQNIITGYGLGGPVHGDVFTLPSLDIFGRKLAAIVTRASRQTGGVFTSTQQGGSIGEGVLKRFNIVYDYPHRQIIAWPSKYYSVPDRFIAPPKT